MAKITGSGQRVLAELSQDPVARKNKYDTLKRQFDALERRADYLATRLEANQTRSNQGAYNAIVQQLQDTESRINNLATEMNSIAEASRYRAQEDRRQQRITDRKPKTTMDKVRESLPYQIGSGIRDMIVDTGKGIGQTALYAENELRTGKAGTQLNPNTMQMEDIQFGDVADTYIKEGAKTAGTYLDFLNSLAYRGFTGRGKPDSEDGRFNKMLGERVPRIFGTKDIVDPTVAKGAEIVADPLALVPVAGRVKAGVDAVTDPKLWEGIARDMSMGTRSNIFVPLTPYTNQMGRIRSPKPELHQTKDYEKFFNEKYIETYSPTIQDAYKKYKQLKSQGVPPNEIFRQTRVFENVDGVPYFETDDSLAKIDIMAINEALRRNETVPLNDVFSHPELIGKNLKQFGEEGGNYSLIKPTEQGGAFYDPSTGNISINKYAQLSDIKSSLLHELTHKEAFDQGLSMAGSNSPSSSKLPQQVIDNTAQKRQEIVMDELDSADYEISVARNARNKAQANPNISDKELIEYDNKVKEAIQRKNDLASESMLLSSRSAEDLPYLSAYNAYLANNNEALARLTQERMKLSGQERADRYILDDGYMKQTVGVDPNDTWFAKYQGMEAIPTYPKYMVDSAVDYLYGNRPLTGKYVMPDVIVDENYRRKLLSGN
jgi:hypothetical protein